jgi:hypothetical protein
MAWIVALVGLALLALIHELVRRFAAKKWRHAIANIVGALAHYVAIVAVCFGFFTLYGMPTGEMQMRITETMPGYAAHGLLERDDIVLAVDGARNEGMPLSERVIRAGGKPLVLTIERGGAQRDVTVQPRENDGRWLLGVRVMREEILHHDPAVAADWAIKVPVLLLLDLKDETAAEIVGGGVEMGGPKRIIEEFTIRFPFWLAAFGILMRSALVALVIQLVVNIVRSRRR